MQHKIVILAALVSCVSACDSMDEEVLENDYVVESILVAGEPLPPIRLSRFTGVEGAYDFSDLAVVGADVRLDLRDESGLVTTSHAYQDMIDSAGVYVAADSTALAMPLGAYDLRIQVPGSGDVITATTVVPDTFRIVNASLTSAVYQGDEQLVLHITRSRSPGRSQSYYLFVTESLNPSIEQATPLAAFFLEDDDDEEILSELRVSGSPIVNESNYDLNADGTLTIRYPWIAVNFFGPNRLTTSAIDDNLYDFVRSQRVQQGGSTFGPGEIPNPIEHIQGGHGLFASCARVYFMLDVLRPL